MKINSINPAVFSTGQNYISKKSTGRNIEPNLSVPACNVKAENLCSKFNITFSGVKNRQLDGFADRLETRIIDMITPKDKSFLKDAFTPDYIKDIENTLKKDNIGSFYQSGISADSMFNYLKIKEQIKLKGRNTAFILDKMSLNYIKKLNKDGFMKFQQEAVKKNIKFYYLETDEEQRNKIINEFNYITGGRYNVKTIKKPQNSKIALYPDADEIKKSIRTFAEEKFPGDTEKQNYFIDIICRYIESSFIAFSYASLCEKLKSHYKNIEKYLKSIGRTDADVLYTFPEAGKSHDIINYLYGTVNNIPSDKFIYASNIKNGFNNNKIYAVLDDICASGESGAGCISILSNYTDNIIFAPLLSLKTGAAHISNFIKDMDGLDVKFLPSLSCRDLGFLQYYFDSDIHSLSIILAVKEYMREFKNLKSSDLFFIINNVKGGCGNTHSFVNLPYMIPDNSSELNAFLGRYFLSRDTLSANKAVTEYSPEEKRISKSEYDTIKHKIDKH